jgi:hypothetical protein
VCVCTSAGSGDQARRVSIFIAGQTGHIDHKQNNVGIGNGAGGRLDHVRSQLVARLMNARRVNEDDLRIRTRQDA